VVGAVVLAELVGLTVMGRKSDEVSVTVAETNPAPVTPSGERPANGPEYLSSFTPPAGMAWSDVRVSAQDGMPQALIPAGEFLMGTTPEQLQAALKIEGMKAEYAEDEQPAKQVHVSAYWMDLHEVTVAQYQAFCQATGREMDTEYNKDARHPVVDVSWDGATAYAEWVGRELPTEAQWETAARGGTTTAYPWGDVWDAKRANGRSGGPGTTTAVASYPPNGYGLYDLIGNVSEWCRDGYDVGWCGKMPARDPVNETHATDRVLRGGSWFVTQQTLRVASRSGLYPGGRDIGLGFRCAASAPKAAPFRVERRPEPVWCESAGCVEGSRSPPAVARAVERRVGR